jgi:hypothetical protein
VIQESRCLPPLTLGRKQIPFSKSFFSSYLEFRTMGKVQRPSLKTLNFVKNVKVLI